MNGKQEVGLNTNLNSKFKHASKITSYYLFLLSKKYKMRRKIITIGTYNSSLCTEDIRRNTDKQ